ncbi:MAG TPA: DUF3467 domain-containing protein [Candidatus Sulfotelmatobacter sp.]|nr:DUF3467 domain-containing protein [Candidatus Sulfotelmatobacter sp.]
MQILYNVNEVIAMAEQEIKINLGEAVAGGVYSNLAVIAHNENEFIMDFIFVQPPAGKVNARVIMSPSHAKRFLKALGENIQMYEKMIKPIKESPEPPKFGIQLSQN